MEPAARTGALGSTWAPRGQPPLVTTTGTRTGDTGWGLIEYRRGRVLGGGGAECCTAAGSCAFLAPVLAQPDGPVLLMPAGAREHPATATQRFSAQHAARWTVDHRPAYAPDDSLIDHLGRHGKRSTTPNRSFPTVAALVAAVAAGLDHGTPHAAAGTPLRGASLAEKAACPRAA